MSSADSHLNVNGPPKYLMCDCGKAIVVIHNPSLMGEVIEEHARFHAETKLTQEERTQEATRIEDLLIRQLFDKVTAFIKP